MTTTASRSTSAAEITAAAIASFEQCSDPRLRQIMQSLIKHVHAFVSDVKLTEDEWLRAIQILTATGHYTPQTCRHFKSESLRAKCHFADRGGTVVEITAEAIHVEER